MTLTIRLMEAMRFASSANRQFVTVLNENVRPALTSGERLPSAVIYAISVFAEKAVSLIMLPITAAFVLPAAYGAYDVAVSVIEFLTVIMAMAIGPTVIRFASTAQSEHESTEATAELFGTSLFAAAVAAVPLMIMTPYAVEALGVEVHHTAFRILTAAVITQVCVEVPLVWIRLKDRARQFLVLVLGRTLAQSILMTSVLVMGYGVPGIMASNGIVLFGFSAVLLYFQARDTGLKISKRAALRIVTYGLPIVGSALAMFALGNLNRFVLPGIVSTETIAHFGLASRLAIIVWLLLYPFELWWQPKRIAALKEPGGLDLSARMWGLGFGLLLFSSLGLSLFGPVLIVAILPAGYAGAVGYIQPLILAQIAHHTVNLTNVGTYARNNGYAILTIDVLGGLIAVTGYLTLAPNFGIPGIIAAMIAGNLVRFALHLRIGNRLAPIRYPWFGAATSLVVMLLLVTIAPAADQMILRTAYTALAAGILIIAMVGSGLIQVRPGS